MKSICTQGPATMAALAVLVLALAGCDQKSIDTVPDTATSDAEDADDPGDVVEPDGCVRDLESPEPLGQAALWHDDGFWLVEVIVGGNLAFPPVDIVQLEVWPSRDGPSEPGEFEIQQSDYADCGLCLLYRQDCTPEDGLALCQRDYLATAGSVELVDLEETGGMISGVIRDAQLVRTDIDWDGGTFHSQPVAGGEIVCIDRIEFESVITPYPAR